MEKRGGLSTDAFSDGVNQGFIRQLDLIWRDLRIVGRAVWLNLALFLALVLGAALLLKVAGSYPGASFSELLVLSFHMTHLESVPAGQGVLATALIFGLPVLTIIILGEGALRVVAVYICLEIPPVAAAAPGGMGPLGSANFFRTHSNLRFGGTGTGYLHPAAGRPRRFSERNESYTREIRSGQQKGKYYG